jgi:catechol 2,3-dioxygenase-like lactoylglutathione lyase family enzyme
MAPDPRIRALRLAHVHYQHPDLDKAVQFLIDFGLKVVERSDDKVYFAGYGIQPYCYVAQQSPDSKRHFLGGYWAVESLDDLLKASSLAGGGDIKENTAPGKGSIVEVQDPNGYIVGFVHGQILNNPSKNPPSTEPIQNGAVIKRRLGTVRRFSQGPSPVHKLGHYGFVVPPDRYEPTLQWYTTLLNLKPTDAIFNPETNKDESCFIHIDRGAEFTDHHVRKPD